MGEQLLFICNNKKHFTCAKEKSPCMHAEPHPFSNSPVGGCADPTCGGVAVVCKPINLNRRTAKQFAKIITERILKSKT